jgi:Cdc6-like AAA superfamily ATPase
MAMTDERLVGREDELAALSDFLDGPPPPRIALLEGEAGIGKTTLWRRGIGLRSTARAPSTHL